MTYYHYTSRLGAQDVIGMRYLAPGRSGRLYLTDVAYADGATAAAELAITGKAVELAVRLLDVSESVLSGPFVVEPWRDSDGQLLRVGGGREFIASSWLTTERAEWFTLEAP